VSGAGAFALEAKASVGDSIVIALRNSVIVTTMTIALTLLISIPMAYSFARFRFRGKRDMGVWILSTRMIPAIASVVPIYLLFRQIGLTDSQVGLALVYTMANVPFAVWALKGSFESVPEELEEAAFIDGYSRTSVMWRITLPLAKGGIIAATMLVMFLTWTEFLFASVLTNRDAVTLPVALSLFRQDRGILWGPMSATIVVSAIPIVVIVVLFQKYLVRGLTAGGIK